MSTKQGGIVKPGFVPESGLSELIFWRYYGRAGICAAFIAGLAVAVKTDQIKTAAK